MALAAIGAVLAFAIICIALGWHRLAGRRAGRDLVPSEDKGEHLQLTSHEENGEHQQLTKAAGTSIVPAAGPPARLRVVLDVQAVACEFIVEVDPTALESIDALLEALSTAASNGLEMEVDLFAEPVRIESLHEGGDATELEDDDDCRHFMPGAEGVRVTRETPATPLTLTDATLDVEPVAPASAPLQPILLI